MSKRRIAPSAAWSMVPDLAVEVVSESHSAESIQGKVDRYLQAGVKLVWVVYPGFGIAHIHDGTSTIRVVKKDGILEGGEVVPGSQLALRTLFEDEPSPNQPSP